ncbi:MAG: T9SS type A sorting domain-containing protein [Bacteroidota bacterium]
MKKLIAIPIVSLILFITLSSSTKSPSPKYESESVVQLIKACHVIIGTGFSTPYSCPANTLPIELNELGELTLTTQVLVTHLSQINGNGDYLLPANTPGLYLRLSNKDEGLLELVGPFEHFAYDPTVQPTNDPLYHANIEVVLDLSAFICKGVNGASSTIKTADIKIELVTPLLDGSGDYELYPIHDYSSPSGIFACSTFSETCFDCPNSNCTALEDPIYEELLCFDCEVDKDEIGLRQRPEARPEEIAWSSQLSPNPFGSEVILDIQGAMETQWNLEIYRADGQLVHQTFLPAGTSERLKTISTEHLGAGLYFFSISDGQHQFFHKMVKKDF